MSPRETVSLTKSLIDNLPVPAKGKRVYYHDSRVRGLGICITWTGALTWYLSRWVASSSQRIRLGEYPGMTIEQARKRAEEENAAIANGKSHKAEAKAKREEMTFAVGFDWYIENYSKVRKRSWKRDAENFRLHLGTLASMKLSAIRKSDVRALHSTIAKNSGPYAANRVLALISVVFSRLIKYDLHLGTNPASGVEPFPERSRERRIDSREVGAFVTALEAEPNHTLRDFVWISLLTGARRSNVLEMRWEHIDLDSGLWRIPLTKSGFSQDVPLASKDIEILKARKAAATCEWVFPGRSDGTTGHMTRPEHGWNRIVKRAGLTNLRLHDLRRSLGSWMVDTGASLPIIGKALGHQCQASTSVYARLDIEPVRQAKERAIATVLGSGQEAPAAARIPPATRRILESWAAGEAGALTGFTGALVRNNLRDAVNLADPQNMAAIYAVVQWMIDELPAEAWGCDEAVRAWKASHAP